MTNKFDGVDVDRAQDLSEVVRKRPVAIVDQIAGSPKEALARIGEVARGLLHPIAVWLPYDTSDLGTRGHRRERRAVRLSKVAPTVHGDRTHASDIAGLSDG